MFVFVTCELLRCSCQDVWRGGRCPAAVLCDGGAAELQRPGHPQAGHPQSHRHPRPQRVPGDGAPAPRRESAAKLPPEGLPAVHQVRPGRQVHRQAAAREHPAARVQLPPGPAEPLPADPEHQAPGRAELQAAERPGEAQGRPAALLRGHQPLAAEGHPEGQ